MVTFGVAPLPGALTRHSEGPPMNDQARFLWGAATAPHQIEGNNVNSDWWAREGSMPGMERSGDAIDSYHRFDEDMRLLPTPA
jgi:beta-glucosidase/6-phospho-beta-glucosidase/beta-galactosidase